MGCFRGHWVTIGGNPVYIEADCRKQTYAVAVTLVLLALTGGGVAGATSAGGSVSDYGPRTSQSEPNARANRDEPGARPGDITDSFRVTSRLQRWIPCESSSAAR